MACALVIDVQTKIYVEPAIAIIIGNSGSGERALRWVGKLEGVRLLMKSCVALIEKKQRAVVANDNQILAAVVVDVDEKRAGGVFNDPYSSCLCDVFERSVAAIAIETVGKASGWQM